MIEHIRKSECEWMNGEANVIMSDWMCECVRRGGVGGGGGCLYSGSNIWHLGSFELHAATFSVNVSLCFCLSFCLPSFFFFFLSLVCSITVRGERERICR